MIERADHDPGGPGRYWRHFASGWHVRFGQLLDWAGRPADAEANYRRALARSPCELAALSGLGRLLLRAGRYEEAVGVWRRVVRLSPGSVAFAFQFSRALHRSGKAEQAAEQYLRVVTLDPLHEKAFSALEQLAANFAQGSGSGGDSGRLERATHIGRQIIGLHPASPRGRAAVAVIARAVSAAAMARLEQEPHLALDHFMAALDLAPGLVEAQRGAALCFERTGQPEKAIALLDRQIEANPQAVEPRLQRERIRASLDEAPPLAAPHREGLPADARRLIAGKRVAPGAGRLSDAQEHKAILARARGLVTGGTGSSTAEGTVDPREREAILARARGLVTGETGGSAAEGIVDPREREAILARARGLVTGEAGDPAAERTVDPQAREAILARARRLITGETGSSTAEETVDPQEREAILAHARGLLTGETGGASAEETVYPQEREAILAHARGLLTGETGGASAEETVYPQERQAILARARRLLHGQVTPKVRAAPQPFDPRERRSMVERAALLLGKAAATRPAHRVEPKERDALTARARRLLAGKKSHASAGDVTEVEPAAEPVSIEQLLQAAQAAVNDGRLEDAETAYRDVLGQDAAQGRALSGLSQVYRTQRRWSDAIDILTRLIVLQPQSIQSRRWLAHALLQDGRLEAAATAYVDLSILEPASAETWQLLGQVQKRLGSWPAARAAWTRLSELRPTDLKPRLELAAACYRLGDAAAAEAALQQVLAAEPDHRAALALLGRVRLATDPEGALVCWSRLVTLDAVALEPRLQVARLHLRQERVQEAQDAFRAVLELQPAHEEALASLGRILAERDPQEALRLFEAWSERDPGATTPWLAIGRLHLEAKRTMPAEAAFRHVLDLAPSNVEALTRLARLHSSGRKVDEAVRLWSKLAELAPEAFEPKLQLARLLHDRNDPDAEQALREVLNADPQNREILRRLAQLLGREPTTIENALEVWNQVAEVDHEPAFAIVHRARLFDRTGRKPEAESEYRRALAFDPEHSMALGDLAEFLRRRQRWQDAIDVYRAHLQLRPERIDLILGLAQCLDRLDRLGEIEELYGRALAIDPNNVTALGYRGRLLRTRGQIDEAIADFRRICALEPGNAGAWRELIFYLAGAEREAEALATLDEAERALGGTPEAWITLGGAAAAALFEDRAIAYFKRAIAARPEEPSYHAQLGLHYGRQGVVDGAFHHLLDSREIDASDVDVARGLFDATTALRELGLDHVSMRGGTRTVGEVLLPERLFHHVRRIAETRIERYEPVPRSVIAISATLAPGGAERQLVNMLRGLSSPAFGLDLTLFCISLASRLRRDFFLPVLDGTGVKVVTVDAGAAEDCLREPEVAPFAAAIRHFPSDMVGPIAFWLQEFRRRRPAVVHAWQDSTNLTAVVAALLAGVPRIILCCRSVHPDNPRRRLRRFMNEAYRAVLDHPSVVMSNNSRAGADDYAEWLGIASERIEVVYNGVDFDRLRPNAEETEQARRQLGIPGGAAVLGGVFRMSEEKRPLLWLDVAAAVARRDENAHFVVCGDGPMRDEMVRYAADLGIQDRVHLPGAQSNIGSWYRIMDVVMLTSRHEGLPNVLLEAQSLGIPVVAPDVGGMSEVVEQGLTGWTVRDADAGRLAERVSYCLSDREWRGAAAARAPAFVRDRFSIQAMLLRNLEVYGLGPEFAAADAH